MWRRREGRTNGIDQVAENQRQITELRHKLDGLLQFFAPQGAKVESAAHDAVPDVPAGPIAASRASAPAWR